MARLAAGVPRRRPRIGLLGGSFNPAHDGHVHISLIALSRLRLDRVWWLVSPQNPLKSETGMASLAERLARARQLATDRRLVASDLERTLHTRYTVDTVAILRRRLPRARFVWIMGADNLAQITRWRRWPELFETVSIAIFDRPTYSRSAMASIAARSFRRQRVPARMYAKLADLEPPAWAYIRAAPHPESATRLRQLGVWPRGGATAGGGQRP
ncbi:MAG: nicotinate-nucleotide adenylyltransferase [Alphaproteobacteria bacterium]|nr:nicotinate-nucleotide adenylyltransferase [Alphaproteobacteria bacterium]